MKQINIAIDNSDFNNLEQFCYLNRSKPNELVKEFIKQLCVKKDITLQLGNFETITAESTIQRAVPNTISIWYGTVKIRWKDIEKWKLTESSAKNVHDMAKILNRSINIKVENKPWRKANVCNFSCIIGDEFCEISFVGVGPDPMR